MKNNFKIFLMDLKNNFEESLKLRVQHLVEKIENKEHGHNHLINLSFKIIELIDLKDKKALVFLAQQQGEVWAKSDLDVTLKYDWFEGFKETYLDFFYVYHKYNDMNLDFDTLIQLERESKHFLSTYLKEFFRSYQNVQSEIINNQRFTIDELATPVIPLTNKLAILPIVGTIDTYRAHKIQTVALHSVYKHQLDHIVIDLSGVTYIDTFVANHLFTIIDSLDLIGCHTILTGISPPISKEMVGLNINFQDITIKKNLKETLDFLNFDSSLSLKLPLFSK